MTRNDLWKGIGIGVITGTVLGMAMSPGKHGMPSRADKAIRTMEKVADRLSSTLGL